MLRLLVLNLIVLASLIVLFPLRASAAPLEPVTMTLLHTSESSSTLMIQAGSTGAPNGVWVEWMDRSDYDANGWSGYARYCTFEGVPTLSIDGTAVSYKLGSNESIEVELGNLFDETGVTASFEGELDNGMEYVARAYPLAGSGYESGTWTPVVSSITLTSPLLDCIHTQGYWKNHEENWPVSSLTLGTVLYTQAELLSILNTPAKGNGLIFLAHQLISAKLNLANGANAPGTVSTAIANADALIGALVVPPVGSGYLKPSEAHTLNEELDSFNNGTGGGNCDPVPAEAVTWGQIKALFN